MFYNPVYLKRNGRFGLIWLAATHSRVLNKRELYSVNVAITCSSILEHIPGFVSRTGDQRHRRFSLYLSSQLMYGSAKILQKQWGFLLVDCNTLIRRIHPEVSPTFDIDLVVVRSDPVTLESKVPTDMKDKNYNPQFGSFKDSTVDVEALLEIWDTIYVERCQMSPSRLPPSVKAETDSPYSVSDPREIQIPDQDVAAISPILPGEQDLPALDTDNLALLDQTEEVSISRQELLSPRISRILTAPDISDIPDFSQLPTQVPGMDETPGVRTGGEMPGTPQKAKRKRRHGESPHGRPDRKTRRGDGDLAAGEEADLSETTAEEPDRGTAPPTGSAGPSVRSKVADQQRSPGPPLRAASHDWLLQNPPLQLSTVTPSPGPVRKRKPHKLIVDVNLQLTREKIKNNILTHETTSVPLAFPCRQSADWLKEPTSQALQGAALCSLWRRNCVFGLRVYDTESESSDGFSSPTPPKAPKRSVKRRLEDDGTPYRLEKTGTEASVASSVERGRDFSARSVSLEGERSRSMVAPANEESLTNISATVGQPPAATPDRDQAASRERASLSEYEQSLDLGMLPPLPEEQEQLPSPVPLPASHIPGFDEAMSPPEAPLSAHVECSPHTRVLRLVAENLREQDDWTTFRQICPMLTTPRSVAAQMFSALCCLAGKRSVCVRQDEPFADIFIWLPADG